MHTALEPAKSLRITIRFVMPVALSTSLPLEEHIKPAVNDAGFYKTRYPIVLLLILTSFVLGWYFLRSGDQEPDVARLPAKESVVAQQAEKPPTVALSKPASIAKPPEPKAKLAPVSVEKKPPAIIDARIRRAQLTSGVRGREPIDKLPLVIAANSAGKTLYYFTELKNMRGTTVTHNWLREGTLMLSVKFNVESNRWRAFSNSHLRQKSAGRWRVEVVDNKGKIITHTDFVYKKLTS